MGLVPIGFSESHMKTVPGMQFSAPSSGGSLFKGRTTWVVPSFLFRELSQHLHGLKVHWGSMNALTEGPSWQQWACLMVPRHLYPSAWQDQKWHQFTSNLPHVWGCGLHTWAERYLGMESCIMQFLEGNFPDVPSQDTSQCRQGRLQSPLMAG